MLSGSNDPLHGADVHTRQLCGFIDTAAGCPQCANARLGRSVNFGSAQGFTLCAEELSPGPALQSPAEILEAFRTRGQAGYHACSTVRMGADAASPLDARLRVKGTSHLRVVDGSVLPSMSSSNTNGPIMAVSWRAASLILEESSE